MPLPNVNNGDSGASARSKINAGLNAVGGELTIPQFNNGSGAGSSTFWRGDGTWGVPPGGLTTGGLGYINVQDFGATGNGSTDDTAAIQAAIDSAYSAGNQVIYLPKGTYKTTGALYLDAPGNLRTGIENTSINNFSLMLLGEDGGANHEGYGTIIAPTFNNATALWVGPGRGMAVRGLQVLGPAGGVRGNQNVNGVGIAISAIGSRCQIENVEVDNFYIGIATSPLPQSSTFLADSNTFYKCLVTNCYTGFQFKKIENYINSLYDCQTASCTIAIDNSQDVDVNVFGGNYSVDGAASAALPIAGISAITIIFDGVYQFTATVTGDANFAINPRVYNSFILLTAHFGPVPLTFVSQAGPVTTFQMLAGWATFFFGTGAHLTASDLQAELQACVTLYCCEQATTFLGGNMRVTGIHQENPDVPTRLFDTTGSFGFGRPCAFRNSFLNYEPSLSGFDTPGTPANYALFLTAMSFPFINIGTASLAISDVSVHNSLALPVDWGSSIYSLVVDRLSGMQFNPRQNSRSSGFVDAGGSYIPNLPWVGGGQFDTTPFGTPAFNLVSDLRRSNMPFWGFRPAPYTRPIIIPGDADVLTGVTAMGAVGSSTVLWGGQQYQVAGAYLGSRVYYSMVSNHHYYSYGQNLAAGTISYKGQSACVFMDATTLGFMFAGLGIILNDGVSDTQYIVTGIYSALGYVTVASAAGGQGTVGTSTTIYTPALVKQEAYSVQLLDKPNLLSYLTTSDGVANGGFPTVPDGSASVILSPAGALTSLNPVMPGNPTDGQTLNLRSTQNIAGITWFSGAGSAVFVGAPAAMTANVDVDAVYRKANNTWYFG